MNIWFTSDTHFGHANIIKYCNRPFGSVYHMDETLIKNWNEVVKPNDVIYHLGDFAMGQKLKWSYYVERLNGYKILILGNHDSSKEKMLAAGFNEAYGSLQYGHPDNYLLIHNPHSPKWSTGKVLCGHVHTAWRRYKDMHRDVINVGVDQWNFRPVSLEELLTAKVDKTSLTDFEKELYGSEKRTG